MAMIGNCLRDNKFMKPDNTYIAKADLIKGAKYKCEARNFVIGRWNGVEFEYVRTKFGKPFMDTERHWDDDPQFGTVKPLKLISKP